MPQRRTNSPRAGLDELTRKQADLADSYARIFKALDPLLRKERVHKPTFKHMIFSRVGNGVVVHLPLKLRDRITKKDLYAAPRALGILANTMAMVDPLSETALDPGVYLVKLRAFGKDSWAFDLVDPQGQKALSTPAQLIDPVGFASVTTKQRIRIWTPFDFSVEVPAGPDDLFPPHHGGGVGPDTLLPHGYTICFSRGWWHQCFFIPTWQTD